MSNLKLSNKYINKEIINLKYRFNKLSDATKPYDLIYLYASPIVLNEYNLESESPISYMEEIRIIIDLMIHSKKQFNCKFECINENVLRDNLINNKTKILHISAHGEYDGKYSLVVENLKKNGQKKKITINTLDFILQSACINLNHIDLVIVSTCYSETFGKKFLEYGAKNVIYINGLTEVIDRISVLFVKYFYQKLLEGKTIEESYENTIKEMKSDEEIILLNKNSCCCNHYHKPDCLLKQKLFRDKIHNTIHYKIEKQCKCDYEQPNYHDKSCSYYYELLKDSLLKCEFNKIKKKSDKNITCCCHENIQHNEILKILYKSNNKNFGYISPFNLNSIGKLFIKSNISFYFDKGKYIYTLGRKNIMGKIFNNIQENGKYIFLLGEKELLKTYLAESLCVYLYERKIINSYVIFRINSEFDFDYMIYKINEKC